MELDDPLVIRAMTSPIRSVELAADVAATIRTVHIKEGEFVKSNQVLVEFRSDVQAIATEIARAEAESTIDIESSRIRLEQARFELDRFEKLNRNESAANKEMINARQAFALSKLDLKKAEFKANQADRAYMLAKTRLNLHTLHAPFDGFIAELLQHEGESIEEQQPVLTLVQIDPLEVVVDCPIDCVERIKTGQRYRVQPTDQARPSRSGTVSYLSKVADPASQTVRIKLNVSNDDSGWLAGLRVVVDFRSELQPSETSVAEADHDVR
jgi:RND family efflux transporter MFP subunit